MKLIERVARAIEHDFDHDHSIRRFVNKEEWQLAAKAAIKEMDTALQEHEIFICWPKDDM